jgi:DNA-binding IclR family transcriptional regulator
MGSRELAADLGLEPTRVNRLLKTLAYVGLAQQDAQRKYRCGPGIHVLAAQALVGSGLLRKATPHLESLRRFGFTVALGVLWRDKVSYLYHASPETPSNSAVGRVGLFPAEASGLGIAVLAGRINKEIVSRFTDPHVRRSALRAVRQTRNLGYACVTRTDKTSTLAVCLEGQTDAAIGLSGRFADHPTDPLVGALKQAARAIASESCPTAGAAAEMSSDSPQIL